MTSTHSGPSITSFNDSKRSKTSLKAIKKKRTTAKADRKAKTWPPHSPRKDSIIDQTGYIEASDCTKYDNHRQNCFPAGDGVTEVDPTHDMIISTRSSQPKFTTPIFTEEIRQEWRSLFQRMEFQDRMAIELGMDSVGISVAYQQLENVRQDLVPFPQFIAPGVGYLAISESG